jgi:hypothetical protein
MLSFASPSEPTVIETGISICIQYRRKIITKEAIIDRNDSETKVMAIEVNPVEDSAVPTTFRLNFQLFTKAIPLSYYMISLKKE